MLVLDLIDELNRLPLYGLIVTAPHLEDIASGAHLSLLEDAVEASDFPVMAAGPFSTINDLRAVADRGVYPPIVGLAL